MITIKSFKGFRPPKEVARKLASYPYDVIDSDEAREIADGNSCSFLHVVKPEIDLPGETDVYDQVVYQTGADNLKSFMEQDWLVQDQGPRLYVYQQKMGDHLQTGLVCCCSVDDYWEDRIKKHEHTRAKKEEDRVKHVDVCNANTGPVFLTYRSDHKINKLIDWALESAPEYDFKASDGIRHIFTVVENPEIITELKKSFERIDCLYVADGHHRAKSAARVGKMRRENNPDHTGEEEYNFFLTVLFPHDQLMIMDYNRVVTDLNGLDKKEFSEKIKENFTLYYYDPDPLVPNYKPTRKGTFGMYIDEHWYMIEAKPDSYDAEDPVGSLDVSILQNNLLEPVLAISNPREDNRINFIGGFRGMKELKKLVDNGKYRVAFSMFPTSITDLMNVADSGEVMPPKSTWFEPKLRSGMVVRLLD